VTRPWTVVERVASRAGELELRRRGERDYLITLDGRVLMTSAAHGSEVALAEWACAELATARPRVLIGGLGMGYTLRAALDALPVGARVLVAELEPAVVRWCRGPLAGLTRAALRDPRVAVHEADVMEPVRAAARGEAEPFDAVAVDLFEGPRGTPREEDDPLYGAAALAAVHGALAPAGVFAVWGEAPAPGFARRLERAGFRVETRRAGRGGRRHVLYRASALPAPPRAPLQARGSGRRRGGGDAAPGPRRRRR